MIVFGVCGGIRTRVDPGRAVECFDPHGWATWGRKGDRPQLNTKKDLAFWEGTTLHFQQQAEPGDTLPGTVWKGASSRGDWIEHLWSGPELSSLGGRR